MTKRIAIVGMAIECSSFSVWTTQLENFIVLRGEEMEDRYPFLNDYEDIEFVPLIRARSLPGGPVAYNVFQGIKAEMLALLEENGPWDGVYHDMHGAMNVRDMDDAEGEWMQDARKVVGPDCIMAASYDLHGNVSARIMENLDILSGYRTAPHIDGDETRLRTISLLVESVREGYHPKKAFIPVPIALPGERTSTEWEPGMSLYAKIPDVLAREGVTDVTIQIGYAWADEPRTHGAIIALGTDQEAVNQAAKDLAQAFWDVRAEFDFGVPVGSSDEVIEQALASPESTVFISDSGDNPTAGGVGDVTYTLKRLIERDVPSAVYASIPDKAAVEACFEAGVGAEITVTIGGKLDTVYSEPLTVTGTVLATETFAREEYGHVGPANKQAVLQVGGVKIILTEVRTPFHFIKNFQRLGIEPLEHKLVVIKIGYLEPDLKKNAPKAFLALSPGAVNQDLPKLGHKRIERPMFPFDADMTWVPEVVVS
ncbi:M81 family metallopeptidase [Phototrophicus methaneseepsis]|uniref:M81 family metallopeptidase n=1 Tax=Phototrophicus methaneseepsis TaxID=2710758 RepID=A0A7S8IG18_9CHLR|nr:M81 family metallopeptidase [Phototrophicus methaneseepsis]QPC84074.1 M81 family metallopeptidase [Phototrophicus methaneseepsis]